MTKKTKKPRRVVWDPIELPKQPGYIADSRSGKKIYFGRGRRRDLSLKVLDKYANENKHLVIGSRTKHTESEHKIEKTIQHTTPRRGVEKRLTTPTVPTNRGKSKKKRRNLTPQFDYMNKPAAFKKGDRVLHVPTAQQGVVLKQVLYLNQGKWMWSHPLILFDNGQEQIITEQELVKVK